MIPTIRIFLLLLFALTGAATKTVLADTIDAGPGVDKLAVLPGDVITIHGTYGHSEGMESCALMIKRTVLASHIPTSGVDEYSYTYTAPSATGYTTLDIVYASSAKPYVLARKIDIEVIAEPPIQLGPIPPATFADVDVKATRAASTVAGIQGFLDSGDPINAAPDGAITLPIDKTDSGAHTFYAESTDDQGYCYRTPACVFSLPSRVKVWISPVVTIAKLGQLNPVYIKFIPGLTPTSVNYIAGTDVLGTSTAAPWSMKIPLPGYQTGDYTLCATVTSANGARFKADPVSFHLINVPADNYNAAHQH